MILEFSDTPLAQEAVAEIWPLVVDSFEPTTFTYVVKPTFAAGNAGFDRLEILTHLRIDHLLSVTLDGEPVDTTQYRPTIEDDRLVVAFPLLKSQADSDKQLEVVFQAQVLRFGTQFDGFIANHEQPDAFKQRLRAGNATFRFAGDALSVSTPVGGDLLIEVDANPNPFTPNGDGVNDELTLSYKLREVTALRDVALEIYDLAGRRLKKLSLPSLSGVHRQRWNGRDDDGQLVPPGTYLYKLTLDAERHVQKTGILSVAY